MQVMATPPKHSNHCGRKYVIQKPVLSPERTRDNPQFLISLPIAYPLIAETPKRNAWDHAALHADMLPSTSSSKSNTVLNSARVLCRHSPNHMRSKSSRTIDDRKVVCTPLRHSTGSCLPSSPEGGAGLLNAAGERHR